jgi:hypothetical protein
MWTWWITRINVLAVLLATCAWGQQPSTQVGASPKEATPELYRRMKKEIAGGAPPTIAQLTAQTAAIRKENAAAIEALQAKITALTEQVTKALGDKDMSRVSVLEHRADEDDTAKDKAQKELKDQHDSLMAWVRPTAGAVFAAVLGICTQIYLSKRRDGRYVAQAHQMEASIGDVNDHVAIAVNSIDGVGSSVDKLKTQTDGMTERLERMARAKGFEEGKVAERVGKASEDGLGGKSDGR